MLASINSRLEASSPDSLSPKDSDVSYADTVIGAAIFDLNGLPKEYFTTKECRDVSWVQTIFQALGLQSLLISSLRLDGFRHVIVYGKEYRAIVVRQRTRYTAILVQQTAEAISPAMIQWAQEFAPETLKTDPRFSAV